jgi:hypothetical protein
VAENAWQHAHHVAGGVELGGGRRIRVDRDVDAAALERVLEVLARR